MASTNNTPSLMDEAETAIPTLRVMRLQRPELHQSAAGSLQNTAVLLERALCLPDSLAVYVGERFTAYLGILNTSAHWPIRRLTVAAQLQTPSQRWQLPSQLDAGNLTGGLEIEPLSGIDAIVSHAIEEPGQHILRVEVGYMTADGGNKTFRKFYRFQVTAPLTLRQSAVRCGDNACFVSVDVEYNLTECNSPIVIRQAKFVPSEGLSAKQLAPTTALLENSSAHDAVSLYDQETVLMPNGHVRYLFQVEAASKEAILRGIAADDLLGRAVFGWCKAMGECGECVSTQVFCPPVAVLPGDVAVAPATPNPAVTTTEDTTTTANPAMAPQQQSLSLSQQTPQLPPYLVVHRSGLSVDVASAAAAAAATTYRPDRHPLLAQLAITVEPIDPPSRLFVNTPVAVQFLVVNHTERAMTCQVQFGTNTNNAAGSGSGAAAANTTGTNTTNSGAGTGVVVCGKSFQTLGSLPPRGGSTVVTARFVALQTGWMRVPGCTVVDLSMGHTFVQPPLFHVLVVTLMQQQQQHDWKHDEATHVELQPEEEEEEQENMQEVMIAS